MAKPVTQQLSTVFDYPSEEALASLSQLISSLQVSHATTATLLSQFRVAVDQLSVGDWCELYTSTFDLSPACAPYLSVHLFGEDSPKRATLMTGLVEAYAAHGVGTNKELPDHLAVVLSAIEKLPTDLRSDLIEFCLRPALTKMHTELLRCNNPYHFAVSAVEACLDASYDGQEVRCA